MYSAQYDVYCTVKVLRLNAVDQCSTAGRANKCLPNILDCMTQLYDCTFLILDFQYSSYAAEYCKIACILVFTRGPFLPVSTKRVLKGHFYFFVFSNFLTPRPIPTNSSTVLIKHSVRYRKSMDILNYTDTHMHTLIHTLKHKTYSTSKIPQNIYLHTWIQGTFWS